MKLKEKIALGLASVALIAGASSAPAFAQASSSPIDELESSIAEVSDTYDDVVPVAVGAMVFAVGAMLIKRIAYA